MVPERPDQAQHLQALVEKFRLDLPQRVKEIRDTWMQWSTEEDSPFEADGPLRRLVHNLTGAAGTFGQRELGEEAGILERELISLGGISMVQMDLGRREKVESLIQNLERLAVRPAPDGG